MPCKGGRGKGGREGGGREGGSGRKSEKVVETGMMNQTVPGKGEREGGTDGWRESWGDGRIDGCQN